MRLLLLFLLTLFKPGFDVLAIPPDQEVILNFVKDRDQDARAYLERRAQKPTKLGSSKEALTPVHEIRIHSPEDLQPGSQAFKQLRELHLTQASKITIVGHGSPGGGVLAGRENGETVYSYFEIGTFLAETSPQLAQPIAHQKLRITTLVCHSALGCQSEDLTQFAPGFQGNPWSVSLLNRLATLNVPAEVSGNLGRVFVDPNGKVGVAESGANYSRSLDFVLKFPETFAHIRRVQEEIRVKTVELEQVQKSLEEHEKKKERKTKPEDSRSKWHRTREAYEAKIKGISSEIEAVRNQEFQRLEPQLQNLQHYGFSFAKDAFGYHDAEVTVSGGGILIFSHDENQNLRVRAKAKPPQAIAEPKEELARVLQMQKQFLKEKLSLGLYHFLAQSYQFLLPTSPPENRAWMEKEIKSQLQRRDEIVQRFQAEIDRMLSEYNQNKSPIAERKLLTRSEELINQMEMGFTELSLRSDGLPPWEIDALTRQLDAFNHSDASGGRVPPRKCGE